MDIGKQMRIKRNQKRRNRMYGTKKRNKMPKWIWIFIVILVIAGIAISAIFVRQRQKITEEEQKLKIQLQKDKDKEKDEKHNPDETVSEKEEGQDSQVLETERKAKEIVDRMSVDEKILGMIITSPEDFTGIKIAVAAGDQTKQVLQQYAIGGMTYQEQNFEDISQLELMLTNTKQYSKYPIFLCVNEGCKKAASSSGRTTAETGFNVDMTEGWKYLNADGEEVNMETTLKIKACSASEAVKTVQDGADVIVLTDGFDKAYRNIRAAIKEGSITESRLDESMQRIMELKVK